jgi:hypothetical protein
MKQFLTAALFAFSLSANADVIKPKNTIEDAVGVVTVSGVQFDYRVSDRAWETYAQMENGKIHIEAQKSFLLRYVAKNIQEGNSFQAELMQDGAAKCQELGEIEYAEQIKSVPDYLTSLNAEIVNTLAENASYGSPAWATLVCMVTVKADK